MGEAATDDEERVWLVERSYSDDEQNLIIQVYATPDGERYLRKERALTSFGGADATEAALDVPEGRLSPVEDAELAARYAEEVERVRERYGPDESV